MWRLTFLVGSLSCCAFGSQEFAAQPMMTQKVDDIKFGKYLEMQCAGHAYTVESSVTGNTVIDSTLTKVCNGWADITEKECIQKCIEHAHPAHCHKTKHACDAAVFYPKDPKNSKLSSKGWCHLYEKSQCKKFKFSVGMPVTFVKEQTSTDRRLTGKTCKTDSACSGNEICIGWSYLSKSYYGKCGQKASKANGGICSRNKECQTGHCVTGYCLSQGRMCKNGIKKFGCDYKIRIERKSGNKKLGIQITYPGLVISTVGSSGLVPEWNKAHPSKAVKSDDRIIKVNGKMFWDDASLDAIKDDDTLDITLMVGHVSATTVNQKWEIESAERFDGHLVSPSIMACILVGLCALVVSGTVWAIKRQNRNTVAKPSDQQKFLHAEEDPAVE